MIKTVLSQSELKLFKDRMRLKGDVEGYFCTVEELRELFNAGRDHESNINEFPSFKEWLASKEEAE